MTAISKRIIQRRRRQGIYPSPWSKMPTTKYHQYPYLSSTGMKKMFGLSDTAHSDAFTEGTLVHEAIEDYLLTGRIMCNRFNGLTTAKKTRCVNCVYQAVKYIDERSYNIVEGSLFASRDEILQANDHLLADLTDRAGVDGVRVQCDAYDNGILTDWKTTSLKSPYEMNDAVAKYGYILSLWFYIRVMAIKGISVDECELVFLRKYSDKAVILTYPSFRLVELGSKLVGHYLDNLPTINDDFISMRGTFPTLN